MSGEALFRSEAVEHRRRRLLGDVIVVQPLGQTLMTGVLTLFSLVGFTFLVTGTYSKTETVSGYIVPSGGLAQIYANHGGIVTRVLVHEGDVVAAGAPLVELSLETAGSDGVLGEKLKAQTAGRIAEIDKQTATANVRYADDRQRLKSRMLSINQELASLKQRLSSESEMLRLQQDDVRRYAELERTGDGTHLELNRRRQLALTQEGTIRALEQQLEQRRGDLKDAESQLTVLPTEHADKMSQLRSARSELQQSLAQLEINSAYIIAAPVSGRIAALQVDAGQSASTEIPLAAIVPEGGSLEANLLVPSRSAGLIKVGQDVRIRVDAFSYQRFGMLKGQVQHFSKASYRPGELLAPIQYQDTVYRVIVSLERTHFSAYGEERSLTPGMTLKADVVTDHRRFIDTVLDPIRAISARAS